MKEQPLMSVRLGEAIRARRLKKRYSQEGLADEAGVDRSHMGKIERGEVAPTVDVVQQIADALGVSMSRLIKDAEKPERAK